MEDLDIISIAVVLASAVVLIALFFDTTDGGSE